MKISLFSLILSHDQTCLCVQCAGVPNGYGKTGRAAFHCDILRATCTCRALTHQFTACSLPLLLTHHLQVTTCEADSAWPTGQDQVQQAHSFCYPCPSALQQSPPSHLTAHNITSGRLHDTWQALWLGAYNSRLFGGQHIRHPA